MRDVSYQRTQEAEKGTELIPRKVIYLASVKACRTVFQQLTTEVENKHRFY